MNIDVHNHFLPKSFFKATREGGEWFGAAVEKNAQGQRRVILNGRPLPLWGEEIMRLLDVSTYPRERIRAAREEENFDAQVLGIVGYFANCHLETSQSVAFCREINEELAELESDYPANFVGLAMLPWDDTGAALKELEYAARDLHVKGVFVTTHVNGRDLDDPEFLPVFEAIASEGLFALCHPAFPVLSQRERLSRYVFPVSIGAPVETTLAITSLIFGGVLDRCPDLKICFLQGGGFALYNIGRLSFAYHTKAEARTMERPPEEYLGRLYYDCQLYRPEILKFLVDRVGARQAAIGTDFPLPWRIPGGAVNWIEGMDFLSEIEKADIKGANLARLFGLKPS